MKGWSALQRLLEKSARTQEEPGAGVPPCPVIKCGHGWRHARSRMQGHSEIRRPQVLFWW